MGGKYGSMKVWEYGSVGGKYGSEEVWEYGDNKK